MAAYTSQIYGNTTTNATLQALATFVSNALNSNWIQTADTGQTAAGSLVYVSNTISGYQIWRMNDTLQATVPVFMKIEYGNLTGGAWEIAITIGTGSNGSGTITGILVPRIIFSASLPIVTPYYASCATNRFSYVMYYNANTTVTILISIERSKDSTGADTSDGIMFTAFNGATAFTSTQYIPFARSARPYQTIYIVPVPGNPGSLANGAAVGLVPILPFDLQGIVNPGSNLLVYYGPDISIQNVIPVTIHGTSHNYLALGNCTPIVSASWPTSYFAMLYE